MNILILPVYVLSTKREMSIEFVRIETNIHGGTHFRRTFPFSFAGSFHQHAQLYSHKYIYTPCS